MVRAMHSRPRDFELFFQNSIVAVGWSEVNFANFQQEETEALVGAVNDIYYSEGDIAPQTHGRWLNQVRRFHNIQPGDYILVPYYNSIRLAVAGSELFYVYEDPALEADLSNQRKVQYQRIGDELRTVPRDLLSEALQRRLRVRGSTVSDLYEFQAELEELFANEDYSWASQFEEREQQLRGDLAAGILEHIRKGNTNLKTGGIGLEHLVRNLFDCEGYQSEVLAKQRFKDGDADVLATKADRFGERTILAQVKHHSGYSDDWGLQQLRAIQQQGYEGDYTYVFITSARIADQVREQAEKWNIIALDGAELADWIVDHIEQLPAELRIQLGVSGVPQLNRFER